MKAVYTGLNGIENLEIRELPEPAPPAENQVLVRVRCAGLNRADLLQARGLYPPPPGYSPNVPGLEFAGEVAGVEDGVKNWSEGDRVFGITAGEAQAEYLLIDESLLTRIPETLTFPQAAAIPEAFITAHDALFTLAGLKSGESLLIHAVGSGVGLAALQLAKAAGATVIGTSRTEDKLAKCERFGLDAGISTAEGIDFVNLVRDKTQGKGVDVILDLVGAAYFEQNLNCLTLKGRIVLVGLTSGRSALFDLGTALQKRAKIIGTVLRTRALEEKAEATREFSRFVVPLIEAGTITPNLDRTFAFQDVAVAYKYLESNQSFGKVVLEI